MVLRWRIFGGAKPPKRKFNTVWLVEAPGGMVLGFRASELSPQELFLARRKPDQEIDRLSLDLEAVWLVKAPGGVVLGF